MILQEKLSPQRFWQLTSLGAICFVGLWTAAALAGLTSPQFLPTPWAVLDRFVTLWSEPFAGAVLHEHVLASMRRFFLGFGFAVLVGLPLGLLMAWFQPIDRLITPLFETIRFVAPIAWIPSRPYGLARGSGDLSSSSSWAPFRLCSSTLTEAPSLWTKGIWRLPAH